MKIINKQFFDNSGIYFIRNIANDKIYIGNTVSFKKRYSQHVSDLKNQTHKNIYLQNSYNKYGESFFEFEIIECINDDLLKVEQNYINSFSFDKLYNINPNATGGIQFSKEIINRRSVTNSEIRKEASIFYRKFKNKEISLEEIPEKYIKIVKSYLKPIWNKGKKLHFDVWNKGKKYTSTEHLKVKKTFKCEKAKKESYAKRSEIRRNKLPSILIYDFEMNFIAKFNSAKDIEDYSLSLENKLPIKSKNKVPKQGKPVNYLCSGNINKSCKTGKSYKGLYFKYENAPL